MTTSSTVSKDIRLPRWAALVPGRGGQPKLLVDTPLACAEIYLHGATLTSYVPVAARGEKMQASRSRDLIFTSRQAVLDGTAPIRGGVPLCAPVFGAGVDGNAKPKHGFVRQAAWNLVSVNEGDHGEAVVLLSLESDGLSFLYEVVAGRSLHMSLSLRNLGPEPRRVEAALHHYFAVGDVTAVTVEGLDGTQVLNTLTDSHGHHEGAIRPRAAIDSIYSLPGAPEAEEQAREITVTDPAWSRKLLITGRGMTQAVVWNPWASGAAGIADLADDEWAHFLCVEAARIREHAPLLDQGASMCLSSEVTAVSL